MLRALSLGLFLSLWAGFALASQEPRYSINAEIDTFHKSLKAHQSVVFTNTSQQPIREVYFHIYANRQYTAAEKAFMQRYASYFKIDPPEGFTKSRFEVSSVRTDGQPSEHVIEGQDRTLMKVVLSAPLDPGKSVTIDMDFQVGLAHSFGRLGWYDHIMALSRWYPILSVLGPQGWDQSPFYPFHRPFFSESSYYSVTLLLPAGQVVIHSGDLVKQNVDGAQQELRIETPLPIREFSMAISPDFHLFEEHRQGIDFKAYYLPGHLRRAQLALKDAQDLMEHYTKLFGPYSYKSFSIAPVHLGYGGEQMSNMIFIDTRVFELPSFLERYFDFLIAHETGHQWFYNILGANDFTQMWLEEGVNSYFLMEYLLEKYGADAQVVQFPAWAKLFIPELSFKRVQDVRYKMASRLGYERPVINKLSSFREPSSIFTFTYGKGSKVVEMLKLVMGEEAFARAFKQIFQEYRFKNLDIEDFKRITSQQSQKDLSLFFQQWLYTTKTLDVRVDKVQGQDIYVSRKSGIVMPVELVINHQDGSQETQIWDAQHQRDILSTSSPSPIKSVELDPHQQLLDIDRVNNRYPRRIHSRFVPLYHGLYDIPVFLQDDGYNWITGLNVGDGVGIKSSFQKPYDYNAFVQTGYDFNEHKQTTREAFEIKNILHSQTSLGLEAMQRADFKDGQDDLNSQKLYLRRELWPAAYSLSDINDHLTLYALRNRTPQSSFFSREKIQNTSYQKHNEAIVGVDVHIDRAGPHPDVKEGYATDLLVENSGHWAGATQAFSRASIDQSFYHPALGLSKMAYRLKYGWGSSSDKNLFELGGMDGLRGYDRKTVRAANMLLASSEYRFPLLKRMHVSMYDHILGLEEVSGAVFFDAGEAWYNSFEEGKFRKDMGAGLRFHLSVGSFLEHVIVRIDVAHALDDPKQDTHTWIGINQAF